MTNQAGRQGGRTAVGAPGPDGPPARRRWRLAAVALAVAAGLLAVACGGGSDSSSGSPDTSVAADPAAPADTCTAERVGGQVNFGVFSAAQGLSPLGPPTNGVVGGTELMAIYDALIAWDESTGTYEPWLAESLASSNGNATWTLKLRPGITFGSGNPLDAEAVKWTIEQHQSPENTLGKSRPDALLAGTVTVVDPLTLTFQLETPLADFPGILATKVGMPIDPAVYQQLGPEAFALDPQGAGVGPYAVQRYAPGEELVLAAKDDYWDGPVCIETLRFVQIPGGVATYEAFRSGQIQMAFLRDPVAVASSRDDGVAGLVTVSSSGESLAMNAKSPALSNPKVRRAAVAALNPELIGQRAYEGTAPVSPTMIAPGMERIYPGDLADGYDPDLAGRLVAEAKAEGWDGTVRLFCDNTPARVEQCIASASLLEAAGFTVQMDSSMATRDLIAKVTVDRDYDIATVPPNVFEQGIYLTLSRQLGSASSSNYFQYANPAMDAALEELKMAGSADEQQAILAEMQEIFNEDPAYIPLFAVEEVVIYDDDIHGLILNRGSIVRFDKAYIAS